MMLIGGLSRRLRHFTWCQGIQCNVISSYLSSFTIHFSNKRHFHSDGVSVSSSKRHGVDIFPLTFFGWGAFICGSMINAALADDSGAGALPRNDNVGGYSTELRRIEDGSIISNEHTVKWRIFTDNGRSLFLKGRIDEAEKFFKLAIQEAKDGFGDRDAHVASSLNNLAELYRVKKEIEMAEPLYLDAIEILEESFGPDDIRVGAAFHNLGQFYIIQRKFEQSYKCYERSLKIKGRVLGYAHPDYADTMYHLGMVSYLLGKIEDSKVLVEDSIKVLEDGGYGQSTTCIRRMKYLSQILRSLNQVNELESLQRKILHILELSKGWDTLDTVSAAENLALTLQSCGNLVESRKLLEKCLNARKCHPSEDHVEMASDMLYLAKNSILHAIDIRQSSILDATNELDKAKGFLDSSLRIVKLFISHWKEIETKTANNSSLAAMQKRRAALITLVQSLDAVGFLEVSSLELLKDDHFLTVDSRSALDESVLIFENPMTRKILDLPDVKAEYLLCLKHLLDIVRERDGKDTRHPTIRLHDLEDKVRHIEAELSSMEPQKQM